jgi:hypothetical protein
VEFQSTFAPDSTWISIEVGFIRTSGAVWRNTWR